MKIFFLRLIIIVGYLTVVLAAGLIALGYYGPANPGSVIFPIQAFAEHEINGLNRDPVLNANNMLNLVERRINGLIYRTGSKYELVSLQYLDKSIDQAALAISKVPQDKSEVLRARFISLAGQAGEALLQLKHVTVEDPAAYTAFEAKVQTILHMVGANNVQNTELVLVPAMAASAQTNTSGSMKTINSARGLIPWPAGSPGAVHAFYPLTGQHATLTCVKCHNEGVYLSTPDQCIDCHIMKMPIPHYPGGCEVCHTSISWTDIHFDHIVVNTFACASCHEKDKPANHYNGPCSACHITQNWTTVTFDHAVAGAVDCISCHSKVVPARHYAGQCSNCHNTSNWTSVVFDHTGFSDCISCHASAAPANHYNGQCGRCHSTSTWKGAVFDHSGLNDCISCHASAAPAGHYGGQCSNCHSTSGSWANAHFNHAGFTDCIGCHANRAPANHYPGQCSNCHSTNSWGGAVFNHAGFTDCISCHLKDRPSQHDQGQCSECHDTQHWGDGGNSVESAFVVNNVLQPINCAMCHQTVTYNLGEEIKQ